MNSQSAGRIAPLTGSAATPRIHSRAGLRRRVLRRAVLVFALAGAARAGTLPQTGARDRLALGTATAGPGETAYGAIEVAAGADAAVSIPVAVIHGLHPGPVLALMAGTHGTEYTTIVALSRFIAQTDPRVLRGSLIVIPLANPASFEQMAAHVNPVDGKSLFGPAPDAGGTQSQRILAALGEAVRAADVLVDLHGGDLDEDARPFSLWLRGGRPDQDAASLKLARAFGLDHIQIRDIDPSDPAEQRALPGYALSQGKTTMLVAVGRSGLVDAEDLRLIENGLKNLLGSLGMIDHPVSPVDHPVFMDSGHRVIAFGPGMFFPAVSRGSRVSAGARVGSTTDLLGRPTGEVWAPVDGIVNYIRGVPSMWKGATLVMVSAVLSEVPPYAKPAREEPPPGRM